MRVLVADDSKTNLAMITASLAKLGHETIPASSGQEAIELMKQERPDLIILDVVMEGMDGFECAKRLRALDDQDWIPIIFLSGSVDDNSIAKGINAGGDDYLCKPFSEITLAAKIKAMQRIAEMRKKLFTTTKELQILSSIDTLTGVYNRFQFEKTIKEKLSEAERYQEMIAILFIDLDHFKTINDSLGHHAGDLLLKEFATRLKKAIRLEDFLARLGGDEFAIVLTHVKDITAAGEVARKILSAVKPIYNLEGHHIKISASIGIAIYPQVETTRETLIQNADIAMYHAKEMGRNNFQYFTDELNRRYKRQISLEHELKFALEKDQLFLHYQPICNLLTKKIIGMEALVRWHHPQFGLLNPSVFIPIAEETGMIVQIGTWVLKKACEQRAQWYMQGFKDVVLSVNLSLHQFMQQNFYTTLLNIIQECQLNPKLLELELTETTVITYTNYLKTTIKRLHNLGIGISVDDFGTRYSSLTSLRYLPISTLKIDKAFLKDIPHDDKNSVIVKSLIALGNNLNINVIAEGVQTEEQLEFLLVNDCFYGQGYLLSRPLSSEDMTQYLHEQLSTKEIA